MSKPRIKKEEADHVASPCTAPPETQIKEEAKVHATSRDGALGASPDDVASFPRKVTWDPRGNGNTEVGVGAMTQIIKSVTRICHRGLLNQSKKTAQRIAEPLRVEVDALRAQLDREVQSVKVEVQRRLKSNADKLREHMEVLGQQARDFAEGKGSEAIVASRQAMKGLSTTKRELTLAKKRAEVASGDVRNLDNDLKALKVKVDTMNAAAKGTNTIAQALANKLNAHIEAQEQQERDLRAFIAKLKPWIQEITQLQDWAGPASRDVARHEDRITRIENLVANLQLRNGNLI